MYFAIRESDLGAICAVDPKFNFLFIFNLESNFLIFNYEIKFG